MGFEINTLVPELWCSDFAESLGFYVDDLGFDLAQRNGTDAHAYLSLQGAQIMIAHWTFDGRWEPWYPKPMERPFGRGLNLQFMINGVQDLHDRIVSRGHEPFLGLHDADIWRTDRIDTRRQFMVLDPDGYLLRFAETVKQRPITSGDPGAPGD